MNGETPHQTFQRWLSDGSSWIAIFENQDLSHRDRGRRIAMVYDNSIYDKAEIGKLSPPDSLQVGMGWRYKLVAKAKDADRAQAYMHEDTEERAKALALLDDRDSASPEELEAAEEILDSAQD